MGWHKLGSTTLNEAKDDININIDNMESVQILTHKIPSGNANVKVTINGDSGTNYARRLSTTGGADATATSQANMSGDPIDGSDSFNMSYMANTENEEKLLITFIVNRNTAGATNVPSRAEAVFKYDKTNQISKITTTNDNTGDYTINSNVSVIGTTDDLDKVTQ